MSSFNTRYFKVGIFVLACFFIFIAFIVTFTASALFQRSIKLETYFDESVQGLDIGSPVKHRGVKVGSVDTISFVQNEYPNKLDEEGAILYGRYVVIKMSVPDFVKGTAGSDIKKKR